MTWIGFQIAWLKVMTDMNMFHFETRYSKDCFIFIITICAFKLNIKVASEYISF